MSEENLGEFEKFVASLPEELRPLVAYLKILRQSSPQKKEKQNIIDMISPTFHPDSDRQYFEKFTKEEISLAILVERCRAKIVEYEKEQIYSFSSTFVGLDELGRVKAGKISKETTTYQSSIGTKPNKGVLLKRICEAFKAKRILELGTNTGLGTCYLASSAFCEEVVTIEGSLDLANIARENINMIASNVRVINALFSDAIDSLKSEQVKSFDIAFIDGQHQKDAMVHYMRQIWPIMSENSVFIFDDIFWSSGMNDGWKGIVEFGQFAYVAEIDSLGLAVRNGSDVRNIKYDFSKYIEPRKINAKRLNV